MDMEANLIKGGECQVYVGFHRNRKGLSITIRTTTAIEEFVRGLGDGSLLDIRTMGRFWVPSGKEDSLKVYQIASQMTETYNNRYRLDQPGQPLYAFNDSGSGYANLSFLRLAGISEDSGVTFYIKGVYTMESIKSMRDHTLEAVRNFYISYLKPIDYSIQVISQEMSG